MRLLHTADWHLGRSLHGERLLDAQAACLDHLIEVTGAEQPDAVIVAGDIFDRAYPPVDAVRLYDAAIGRLAALKVPVLITSGNHDSPVRLGMHGSVAEAAGVYLRTRPDLIAAPLELRRGEEHLLLYGVPYLDPLLHASEMESEASHEAVLGAAITRIHSDRARRAPGAMAVVAAHGVVTGGVHAAERSSERVERPLDIGGVEAVPTGLFGELEYVALGHLHRPQGIGERIRYSGAPLPFGFDEAGEEKSVALVELRPGTAPRVELLPTPQPRPMVRLRGTLEELLTEAPYADAEAAWVEATLIDPLRPRAAMEQLRGRFPHLLKLDHEPPARDGAPAGEDYRARMRGRAPLEIAEQFVDAVRGVPADERERALLQEALEAVDRAEATQ